MRWFRSHRTIGSCAALVALALQLALSFAHLHPQDLYGYGRPAGRAAFAAANGPSAQTNATALLRRDSKAPAEVYCGICASINLVGSSQNPAAPRLRLPPFPSGLTVGFSDDRLVVAPRFVHFQSRAPPSA